MVEPNSDITLIRTKFYEDYKHVLDFTSKEAQDNFFNSITDKLSVDKSTFQRKDMTIRVPYKYDVVSMYNYGFYDNNSGYYGSRRYYFFITNTEYINEEMTLVTIKIDSFQTYLFDLSFKPSFIERKHVTDDEVGRYTYPEGLETGEYIVSSQTTHAYTDYYYCACLSWDLLVPASGIVGASTPEPHFVYNGIVSGAFYVILPSENDVKGLINLYNQSGKIENVIALFPIPKDYDPNPVWLVDASENHINYTYVRAKTDRDTYILGNIEIPFPTKLGYNGGSYTPVNKKLLSYPYTYLLADNNVGNTAVYHFELFTNYGTAIFNVKGVLSVGCNIIYIPYTYKVAHADSGQRYNFSELLTGANLPLGSFQNNVYANWFAQNKGNITSNAVMGFTQMIAGAFSAGLGGMSAGAGLMLSGMDRVATLIGSVYDHSKAPVQVGGNVGNGDITYSTNRSGVSFYTMTIKEEYARIIDEYFSMYGYKINRVETPVLRTRTNWNYIKTNDIEILSLSIPQSNLDEIKSIFNRGVTVWHSYDNMFSYNLPNGNI